MSTILKEIIKSAMQEIAKRKPGRSKLVYDRATRTIRRIDPQNPLDWRPTGLILNDEDGDIFGAKP